VTGLTVVGLVAGYGSADAVHGVDLAVGGGEVVGLFGANGAGKSTTLNAIVGTVARRSGTISVDGVELAASSGPLAAGRVGVALVPEDRCLFAQLTVAENLRVASASGIKSNDRALAHFPALAPLLRRKAGLLSGGEQQMLAIARALMTDPKVLLIDELSMGLAPIIVRNLLESIRALAAEGVGVVIVEQHVHLALQFVDRGYVLRRGEVVLEGSAAELVERRAQLDDAYLGTAMRGTG